VLVAHDGGHDFQDHSNVRTPISSSIHHTARTAGDASWDRPELDCSRVRFCISSLHLVFFSVLFQCCFVSYQYISVLVVVQYWATTNYNLICEDQY
jgi:hypothetical protein